MDHPAKVASAQPARRKEIVDAARELAGGQGWPAVTVRAIAGRIGCSAPAIYQYFHNKDAILAALAADGQAALGQALEAAIADVHGPVKRMRALVRAIWLFALDNRELYTVMYGGDGLAAHHDPDGRTLAPPVLRRVAAEVSAKRDIPADSENLADRILATAHGFISLAMAEAIPGGRERAEALLVDVLEALIKDRGRH
jgi:AcrR family transcriptional regulator